MAAERILFNRDIRPLLSENCFQCHGPDAAQRKAGLRLDIEEQAKAVTKGRAAIVPGKPDESELILRIHELDSEDRMPPPETNKQLSEKDKTTLAEWIRQGAPWEQHWAFVPPTKQPLPPITGAEAAENEIDYFVLAQLNSQGVIPAKRASRETLIRRVSLDLNGLPPTPAEVEAFLADGRPDAYLRLVDRLLKSDRYGEHMAWQWLEAARYADTDGYQNDGPRDMWRWRDWVIQAYNQNQPFDEFTIEQLAGDLLPNPTLDQIIATGFNRNHRYNSESGLVFEEFLLENAVDRVDTTSTVWMGLTMGCARCHDHKYDPISQKEYYQLVAYFNNVPESGRAIKFGNSEPWIKAPTTNQQQRLRELRHDITETKDQLDRASAKIQSALHNWETGLTQSKETLPVVPNGLSHHFGQSQPLIAGTEGIELEKIPNLICNGRFSVTFFMEPEQVNEGAILSSEQKSTGRNGILVALHDGHLRFHIISRWIAGVATLETTKTFEPGKTVHVALTNDGTQRAKGMRIYIDGKRATTRVLHNSNSNKSGENFGDIMRIGSSPHAPSWRGQLRDLRFYNRHTLRMDEVRLLAEPMGISAIVALPAKQRTESQANKLTHYFLHHGASSELRELHQEWQTSLEALRNYEDHLPTTMVMEEWAKPKPTQIRKRGVYHDKGELVTRDVPAALSSLPSNYPSNRLGLARWLVNGQHPLTARVIVNRYWQQFFGRGLVKTPEDFGAQGALPSHPALLDWLAVDFVESGWDLHHLIRKIVTSATYCQASTVSEEQFERDPENIFLSRSPRRRLTGNLLRDQALYLGGLLVEQQGGPSVKPFQPEKLWSEASNFTYRMGQGADLYRRSLYTYWKRTLAPPSMALLDTADREWCSVRLKKTNTPLQALTLLNENAFFEAAKGLGQRMLQSSNSNRERLQYGFQAATSRLPRSVEMTLLEDALKGYLESYTNAPQAIEDLLAAKLSDSNKAALTEQAAFTAIGNLLLNLDETTTRE